jgi:hypothetical protein
MNDSKESANEKNQFALSEKKHDMLYGDLLNARLCLEVVLAGGDDASAERITDARDGIDRAMERINDER